MLGEGFHGGKEEADWESDEEEEEEEEEYHIDLVLVDLGIDDDDEEEEGENVLAWTLIINFVLKIPRIGGLTLLFLTGVSSASRKRRIAVAAERRRMVDK
jgi:hypothetical protein